MKIERKIEYDGLNLVMEIELTEMELRLAFEEQRHIYDIESVKNAISDNEDIGEVTEEEIEEVADVLRINICEHEMSFDYALEDAIREVILKS